MASGDWGQSTKSVQWTGGAMEETVDRGRAMGTTATDGTSRA